MRWTASNKSWFVAQTKPNCHHIATRNLERQGYESFLPLSEETARVAGKFVTRVRPLFPGYVFIALDPSAGGWRTINSTYGVTRIVCVGNAPRAVPDDLVRALKQRCDESGKLLPPREFKPGDKVSLVQGPFADFVATVESITPDRRIWVLLEVLGAERRVAVSQAALRCRSRTSVGV
jgi:transcriptional antiterminator RfaH